jgi:benzoyl-CoA reductase subunit D
MMRTLGIDVGTGAVKAIVMESDAGEGGRIAGAWVERIRRRDPHAVTDQAVESALHEAGCTMADLAYVATTGEAEDYPHATGHFYGMTTHARGGLFLDPEARTVVDVGALHARAVLLDGRAKVLSYKMTSQCASGSGQFLENIARYLGVPLEEVGEVSQRGSSPEKVSSICAVLAETDVINMVSRGIATADILRGIHLSMAGRLLKLVRSLKGEGVVLMTGGLAGDSGLRAAMQETADAEQGPRIEVRSHPRSIHAGAIGAALWGAWRHERLARASRDTAEPSWQTNGAPTNASSPSPGGWTRASPVARSMSPGPSVC